MFIEEGIFNGKRLSTSLNMVNVYGNTISTKCGARFNLDKVISIDILNQERKTTTGGGLTGAGAGALLGFLVAGPVGTAVGAGLGSRKKTAGHDITTISIGFSNGDMWVCSWASHSDIAKLKVAVSKNQRAMIQQQKAPTENQLKAPKQKKASNRKKTKKIQQQKVLNKPKKPTKNLISLQRVRTERKIKLPNLEFLQKWKKVDGVNLKALELFNSSLEDGLQKYNNFQWSYFDLKIETEKESDHIAIRILSNLIAQSNELKLLEDEILRLNTKEKESKKQLQILSSKLEDYNKELSETGFFGRGDIKKKISETKAEIDQIKSQTTRIKRKKTTKQKKFNSKALKDLRDIENPLNQFKLIFDTIFPEEKKPKPGLKTKKSLSKKFFLDTYLVCFDEIWDIKIKEDKEKRKKEKRLKENQAKEKKAKEEAEKLKSKSKKKIDEKKQNSSIKERLTELQSLRDDNLITDEEFEISRKKILSSL
jgi:hypothetical protein